jgi:orotate phosphoribosyltransferase
LWHDRFRSPVEIGKEVPVNSFEQDRERLLSLLKAKSFRAGKFKLSSGKESDFYIDCRQTSLCAEGHVLIGRLFLKLIRDHFPAAKAVGGPTLGADPLVSAVSLTSQLENHPLDGFLVRKEPKGHGTGAWIEGMGNLAAGHPVVLLEDVVTTGGSGLRAIEQLAKAELKVLGAIVLVDRLEGGREAVEKAGHKLVALYTRKDFIP